MSQRRPPDSFSRDKIIIIAYCQVDAEEAENHSPQIVFVGSGNKIVEIKGSEEAGEIR